MTTYYVSINGEDTTERDGLSWETAWKSLSYANTRVPEGEHTIQLGAGTFAASRVTYLNSGLTIAGTRRFGRNLTKIVASTDWPLLEDPRHAIEDGNYSEFLIVLQQASRITIRNLILASHPEHRITGAIFADRAEDLTFHNLEVREFRWSGLQLERSRSLNIFNNYFENASTEKYGFSNGMIRTRYIQHSDIYNNHFFSNEGRGYGYKGGGHENVRIYHNLFDINGEFSIESAHENEYGVEIHHNIANQTISIPKGRQGADPNTRGYEYSFWIHHNILTDSYAIEGPRNHLRLSHNYIYIESTGGNVYTHHGGTNNGPIWIHNNVVENVDRGFVWMNNGIAENIFVYNNTVLLADAGERAWAIFNAPNRNGQNASLRNWVIRNNIFIAPDSQLREFVPDNGIDREIAASNNIAVNVTNLPVDNYANVLPGFSEVGDRPWPFFMPASTNSVMVDLGVDVGLPFVGKAPDVGAYEFDPSLSSALGMFQPTLLFFFTTVSICIFAGISALLLCKELIGHRATEKY